MKLGVLCSGGKDSLFACWRAMQKEEVVCLITVVSRNAESYMFHTPNIRLAALQAEAAGLPLVEVETAGIEEAELDDLARAIEIAVADHGIEGVVSGAILSVYQAARIQRICQALDLWCFNPLWHTDQEAYMEELVAAGFGVLVSGVFSEPFDATWLGRVIDRAAIDELRVYARTHRISLTGEGGELETFVFDAPFFSRRIEIGEAAVSYKNYHGKYLITNARLVEK
jgi:diphthine-ammonia ligase